MKNNRLSPRLKSKKTIETLFGGKGTTAITAYPIRATFFEEDLNVGDAPVQVMFSVSKRHFKHAVDRNRVKRQMREVYRLNIMQQLTEHANSSQKRISVAFIWLAARKYNSEDIAQRMRKILAKMNIIGTEA